MIMSKLVTATEVAIKFGVHVETVRRWVREGRIPYYMPAPKTLRFDLESIEKALSKPIRSNDKAG